MSNNQRFLTNLTAKNPVSEILAFVICGFFGAAFWFAFFVMMFYEGAKDDRLLGAVVYDSPPS